MSIINGHTCIGDDGGTPSRRCEGCEREKAIRAELLLSQPQFGVTNIKRAFMEGVIALCEFRKEPAPQWMVGTLWQDSQTRQWAERRLQQS